MLSDSFALEVRANQTNWNRVVPNGPAAGEFLQAGNSRSQPLTLQIVQARQGGANNPVLRQVRTWKATKLEPETGKPFTYTYVVSSYLPLQSSVLTAETGGIPTIPLYLAELDMAFISGGWSITTGPADSTRLADFMRGGA